jgi:acetyl esterase/lipase
MKKIIFGIVLVLLAGGIINNLSQKKEGIKKNIPTAQVPSIQNNLQENTLNESYGKDPRNTITVVLPKNRDKKTPFILFLHGGAWTSGDKKDVAVIQLILSQQGIASAAINYRYASNTVHYKELMTDVGNAVTYIENSMDAWNIGKKKITIGGISAGAHMSLLYAYGYDTNNNISSVISMAGPTDISLTDMLDLAVKNRMIGFVNWLVNDTYTQGVAVSTKFKDASPITYVKNVPTLLIHGNKDSIVLYNQSVKLNEILENKKIPHKLVTIDGANHDLGLANPRNATLITQEVTNWIREYSNK